ncbi:MAG TPA: VWA domain-containing protein [Pyrinomonadaceae bacterium]
MMRRLTASFSLLLLLSVLGPYLDAQEASPPHAQQAEGQEADEVVRVETSLVTVSARVVDRKGKSVSNLRQEDFLIFEEGVQQQIAYFEPVEKPFTVALLLDTSGSTAFRLEDIQKAALAFIDQLRPDDRVMILTFNDQVFGMSEPTSDRAILRSAIQLKPSERGTFLYDAVESVLKKQLGRIEGRKAVVLFTDGVDNVSASASFDSSLREIEESDALVYPIQYDTFIEQSQLQVLNPGPSNIFVGDMTIKRTRVYPPGFTAEHYARADTYLHQIAQRSGTRFYHAGSLKKLSESFALIAQDLRLQYSLGYYPQRPAQPGERRQLNVRVTRGGLVVRARSSYTMASRN